MEGGKKKQQPKKRHAEPFKLKTYSKGSPRQLEIGI